MPQIQLKNVRKVYNNGHYALDGIDLNIEQGEFVSVVGASGCGKTTLLKCIAGLVNITAGELLIAGEIANATRVQERKVGIVFQEYTLYPNMSVFENIAFPLKKQKISYDEIVSTVKKIMEQLGLSSVSAQLPKELSYGQMQRVALARALIKNPDIILFDEPLSNIDEEKKREYRQLIVQTKKLFPDSTYIYVTHNLTEAFSMSDKLLVMDRGKVVQYGPARQLFEYPCNRVVLEALHQNVVYSDCVIRDGCIVTENEKIELSPLQKASLGEYVETPVVCAFYDGYVSCFDDEGDAILGVKEQLCLSMDVNREKITMCEQSFSAEPISEGLLHYGRGTAVLTQRFFSLLYIPDSLKLEGNIVFCNEDYVGVEFDNTRLFLSKQVVKEKDICVGDKIVLYYPMLDLVLYDESGDLMLSRYALNDNVIEADVISARKGIVKIGNRKLKLAFALPKKNVRLCFGREAFTLTAERKKGLEIYVLNEEFYNCHTIVYAEIKGVPNYLTMIFEGKVRCLGNSRNYVTVDLKKVTVVQ